MDQEEEELQAQGDDDGGQGRAQALVEGGGAMDVERGGNEDGIGDPEKEELQAPGDDGGGHGPARPKAKKKDDGYQRKRKGTGKGHIERRKSNDKGGGLG